MTIVKVQGPIPKKLTHQRRDAPRNGTAVADRYAAAVRGLPCCLVMNWGNECFGDTTWAHQDGAGMALKAFYHQTFACCVGHHLYGPNSIGHMGVKAWERKYGPQSKWIWQTREKILRQRLLSARDLIQLSDLEEKCGLNQK